MVGQELLGGSAVVISRVISPLIWVISIVSLLISLLLTTHAPPSSASCVRAVPDCPDGSYPAGSKGAQAGGGRVWNFRV